MSDWRNNDYSNQPKLLKCNSPLLIFSLQLDTSRARIPGLNQGRLTLWDYELGMIYRWVATCSYDGKQNVGDWNKTGGVHPPNHVMPGADWFWMDTKLIVQPGQPVDEGYLPYYRDSNTWKTLQGATRSQIMIHEDDNYRSNPGSYGCLVMTPNEWKCFKDVFSACCGHVEKVRYGVIYTY